MQETAAGTLLDIDNLPSESMRYAKAVLEAVPMLVILGNEKKYIKIKAGDNDKVIAELQRQADEFLANKQ